MGVKCDNVSKNISKIHHYTAPKQPKKQQKHPNS